MYMIWIILMIVLILICILFMPIKVVARAGEDSEFYIKILGFKIRPGKSKNKQARQKKNKSKNKANKSNTLLIVQKIISMVDDIKDLVAFIADRCTQVENVELVINYGTGDAASTGMACGGLNGVAYSAMSVIHHSTLVKKWHVEINPDFQREIFSIRFACIVRTRLLHIISIGTNGLKLYVKFKRI